MVIVTKLPEVCEAFITFWCCPP